MRDYADIYTLISRHSVTHATARRAVLATADFRGVDLVPASSAVENFAELRAPTYNAYRASLGADSRHLPEDLSTLVQAVTTFADVLAQAAPEVTYWDAAAQRWITSHHPPAVALPTPDH